jgi:hypothetical protein
MTIKNQRVADIFDWYGTGAILFAYALVSLGWVASNSYAYQLLNFTGAIGMVMMGVLRKVYPTVALNAVWFMIALIGLVSIWSR